MLPVFAINGNGVRGGRNDDLRAHLGHLPRKGKIRLMRQNASVDMSTGDITQAAGTLNSGKPADDIHRNRGCRAVITRAHLLITCRQGHGIKGQRFKRDLQLV
jgi:hypothetical protein